MLELQQEVTDLIIRSVDVLRNSMRMSSLSYKAMAYKLDCHITLFLVFPLAFSLSFFSRSSIRAPTACALGVKSSFEPRYPVLYLALTYSEMDPPLLCTKWNPT